MIQKPRQPAVGWKELRAENAALGGEVPHRYKHVAAKPGGLLKGHTPLVLLRGTRLPLYSIRSPLDRFDRSHHNQLGLFLRPLTLLTAPTPGDASSAAFEASASASSLPRRMNSEP